MSALAALLFFINANTKNFVQIQTDRSSQLKFVFQDVIVYGTATKNKGPAGNASLWRLPYFIVHKHQPGFILHIKSIEIV